MNINQIVSRLVSMAAIIVVIAPSSVMAQQTKTYTYDARGRLVTVSSSGGTNNGTTSTFSYDAADNRTNVTVTGSANGSGQDPGAGASSPPNARFVVVPINGYSLIFYD